MQVKKQDFVFGAFILSVSGFLVKLIGALFKIPLTNLVGTSAMGYFYSAYSVYSFLLAIATSGVPTGIAAMISRSVALGKTSDVKKIMKIAGGIFISLGFSMSVLGLVFAMPVAVMMNSSDAYWSMAALMPAVFFISVVAVFKGFFQGYNNMAPTAVSNLIEAAVKLVAGIGIASYMVRAGFSPAESVGGAVLGVTISTMCAMLFMLIRFLVSRKKDRASETVLSGPDESTSYRELARTFLLLTFPIIVSSVTSNLFSLLDSAIVVNVLGSYLGEVTANFKWGAYGSALTIYNLPSFLITSIGMSLVPSISAMFAKADHDGIKKTANKALRYSSILAFACAFGLSAVSGPVLKLFYPGDPAGAAEASPLLAVLSFALVSVGLTNITSAMLQAARKSHLPVISVFIGAVLKAAVTFLLVSFQSVNILGAPIATNVAYPIVLVVNLYFMYKTFGFIPNLMDMLLKPGISGLACYLSARVFSLLFEKFLPVKIALFPTVLCAGLVYLGFLFVFKLISVSEIKSFFIRKKKKS